MRLQYIYWKKRRTIRNIKIGEEDKKNQAMAIERFRRNAIASVKLANGKVITDDSQLAGLFL